MAPFLSRLISLQKIFSSSVRSDDLKNESKRVKPPKFNSSKQVRVLLFRELNGQDRKLLYDSKAVRKKDSSASPAVDPSRRKPPLPKQYQESSIEKSFKFNDNPGKDFVYEWQKSSPDEQMLREMIFGSVSISYQGSTLKVHSMRSPPQVMLSVVFSAPPMPMFRIGDKEAEESGNWTGAGSEIDINKPRKSSDPQLAHSVPVNVPRRFVDYGEPLDSDSESLQSHDGYNSLPTNQNLTLETASACLPRSSSFNSLQRRLMRNKATSIELGLKNQDELSNEEFVRVPGQKRVKLGLSVVLSLDEEDKNEERQLGEFVFSHMSLIEGHLMNLKAMVVRAYLNRRNFVQFMFEGATRFQQAMQDLYTSPRLQNPEWLTIISSSNHRHLSHIFLRKFADVLREYDKKETRFFVSTLLSAVLANHLSWVPSVIPTDSKVSSTHASHKHTPYWIEFLAKSRPYNPLWVQLSDLYGALGSTLKLSRTIVKGQNKDVVLKFLQVLSYFIRCSDICEKFYKEINLKTLENELCFASDSFNSEKSHSSNNSDSTPTPSVPQASDIPCSMRLKLDRHVPSNAKTSDTESASDSSKDLCEISITPTEELMNSSFDEAPASTSILPDQVGECAAEKDPSECQGLPSVASSPNKRTLQKPMVSSGESSSRCKCGRTECDCGSLLCYDKPSGDTNYPPNLSVTESREKHPSECQGLPSVASSPNERTLQKPMVSSGESSSRCKCGRTECECGSLPCYDKPSGDTNYPPELSVTESREKHPSECQGLPSVASSPNERTLQKPEVSPQESSARCKCGRTECDCGSHLCYDKPSGDTNYPPELSVTESRECESLEEGYHSMEEPHSPSRSKTQLSDLLKRYDRWCPEGLREVPLSELHPVQTKDTISLFYKSFGWSLMAGVSDKYCSDFCLQGVSGPLDEAVIREDLTQSINTNVLGEQVAEAVCVIADTDKWNVQLLSSNYVGSDSLSMRVGMSSLISEMCDSILNMCELGITSESCIIYLEDRLQELYFRSLMFSDLMRSSQSTLPLSKASSILNMDISDMPLLLSIATTHSPFVQ